MQGAGADVGLLPLRRRSPLLASMTKPSTITDAARNADEDSATQTFAFSARTAQVTRSLVRPTIAMLTLATALTAIVSFSGGAAVADASASGASKAGASNTVLVSKAHPLAKRRAVAPARRRPRHTTSPTTPPATTAPATTPPATTPPATTPPATTPPASGTPLAPPRAGLPDGTQLHTLTGMTITQAGTVIDGADIVGGVRVQADNVVIRNSKIDGQGMAGVLVQSGSLILEDTTITGFDTSVGGDNYTATRVEVTRGFSDGFKIGDNVTIQDSWCHDMTPAEGAHADCGQVQSGIRNATIRRNWFDVGNVDGNAALFMAPDLGPSSPGPLVVENNVLGGGNFTLQCVDGDNGNYFIDDITIRNNEFLRNSNYGPMRINVPATVSGNVYQDNKEEV